MSEKPSPSDEFIAGSFITLLGGLLLLYAFGWANLGSRERQGLEYSAAILGKMFRFPDPGLLTWPSLTIFFSGIFLVARGVVRDWLVRSKRRR